MIDLKKQQLEAARNDLVNSAKLAMDIISRELANSKFYTEMRRRYDLSHESAMTFLITSLKDELNHNDVVVDILSSSHSASSVVDFFLSDRNRLNMAIIDAIIKTKSALNMYETTAYDPQEIMMPVTEEDISKGSYEIKSTAYFEEQTVSLINYIDSSIDKLNEITDEINVWLDEMNS